MANFGDVQICKQKSRLKSNKPDKFFEAIILFVVKDVVPNIATAQVNLIA